MDHKKSLQLQAYEYIKNMVLEGKMQQNEIYSETKIAKELGISRTPVRDAIQYLSQERYIDILPNKGFRLHTMKMQDVIDTKQIRTAIEGYCARQIAKSNLQKDTEAVFSILQNCLEKQKQAVQQESIQLFFDADILFHVTIIEYVNNQELTHLFHSYMYRMRNFALHSLNCPGRMEKAYEEHVKIFENMKCGDAIQTYESVVWHMESPRDISIDDTIS